MAARQDREPGPQKIDVDGAHVVGRLRATLACERGQAFDVATVLGHCPRRRAPLTGKVKQKRCERLVDRHVPALPWGRRARPSSRSVSALPISPAAHLAPDDLGPIVWVVSAPQAQTTGRPPSREVARDLFRRALREHSSPRGIGLSVAVGVFAGCSPWGFHGILALAVATILRLNRLWAFLASRIAIFPVYLAIAFCEIEVGHLLRTGEFARLAPSEAFAHRYELFPALMLGTLVVGCVLAAVAGAAAYAGAAMWQRGQAGASGSDRRAFSSHRLDGSRPPSSGSPKSAPPDPTP
jgi:uncharacterized protein (DUF2062 family)